MSFLTLAFDTEDMIARLRPWIECESPTFDAGALARMVDVVAFDAAAAGASLEVIPGRMGLGPSLRVKFPHADLGKPGILVSGHLDTVHPVGTLTQNPWRRADGRIWGPGIQDMKAGNFVALEAMRQIMREGRQTKLPVTLLLTPDEEIGTPATRHLIEQEGRMNKYVVVPEPASADQSCTIGRFAIARFNLETRGVPSHAGWALKEGRSAIAMMARKIPQIEGMTTEDCTFSVGVIHAGQWVNCVSSSCFAEVLSMAKTNEDLERGVAAMLGLAESVNDVEFIVTRGVTRPVWEPGQAQDLALFDVAADVAARTGFALTHHPSGGGSDGNFTGALGIATLDGTGVRGAGLHTLNEHIFEESLLERARFHAGLFLELE